LTTTAQNILKTLGYFDLFQYPLTGEEVYLFNSTGVAHNAVNKALDELISDKRVFKIGEFYSLHNNSSLAERRRNGNMLAAEHLIIARRVAKFLYRFPYVKAIAVSGSLSKNFATDKTDIDFFIITETNRLWIARTCMHLYKKLTFLRGRQNWFCMNYYVDENAMEIPEKNIFTAVEIVTLLPMHGKECLDKFIEKNRWTDSFFPLKHFSNSVSVDIKKGLLGKLIEKIFAGRLGDYADTKLMSITEKRWRKKVQNQQLNSRGEHLGMSIDRHFSKPDPGNFQEKVLRAYSEKVDDIMQHKKLSASFVL
jgi:predicted nucleotidyltransferase